MTFSLWCMAAWFRRNEKPKKKVTTDPKVRRDISILPKSDVWRTSVAVYGTVIGGIYEDDVCVSVGHLHSTDG